MDGYWNLFFATGSPVFYLLHQQKQTEGTQEPQREPPLKAELLIKACRLDSAGDFSSAC